MAGRIHFLPPQTGDIPEIDRVPGAPHPREMLSLLGQEEAEQAFFDLYTGGKLHHAFLLVGPEGIGKATFAYRAARFLLAEAERAGAHPQSLAVAETSRTAHLVANDAHPDLGVLKRRYDPKTKKFRSEISVEDTRNSLNLFEKTSAFGGWRVIIVDAADDLNTASANALLKTLEEPPPRAVFLLVAHQPQRLLPTIRSRCRVLAFAPLTPAMLGVIVPAISNAAALDEDAASRANGSVKRALRLGQPRFRAFLALMDDVLSALPKRRYAEIDRIAEACRTGAEGEQALADVLESVETWLHTAILARAGAGDVPGAAALADFWSQMSENAARLDALNLDRRAFVMTLVDTLATLVSDAKR
jgi:DNA polymerase III subunit delta'